MFGEALDLPIWDFSDDKVCATSEAEKDDLEFNFDSPMVFDIYEDEEATEVELQID